MKKLLSVLLIISFLLTASSCGGRRVVEEVTNSQGVEDIDKEIIYGTQTGTEKPEGQAPVVGVYSFDLVKTMEQYKGRDVLYYVSLTMNRAYLEEGEETEEEYAQRLKKIEAFCLKYWSELERGEALASLREQGINEEWVNKYGFWEWGRYTGEGSYFNYSKLDLWLDYFDISVRWKTVKRLSGYENANIDEWWDTSSIEDITYGLYISPEDLDELNTLKGRLIINHIPKDFDYEGPDGNSEYNILQ